jgi:hypothetical protein
VESWLDLELGFTLDFHRSLPARSAASSCSVR